MILKFYDGKEAWVSEADGENIAKAINGGAKLLDLRRLKLGWIAPGAISRIESGGVDPSVKQIEAPPKEPYDEEKAAKNLTWLRSQLEARGILKKAN